MITYFSKNAIEAGSQSDDLSTSISQVQPKVKMYKLIITSNPNSYLPPNHGLQHGTLGTVNRHRGVYKLLRLEEK